MSERDIRNCIDTELHEIQFSEQAKQRVMQLAHNSAPERSKRSRLRRSVIVCIAACALCITTVFAAIYMNSVIKVNDAVLPELDSMQITDLPRVTGSQDEYGTVEKSYDVYDQMVADLGIKLLDTTLEGDNPYMQIELETDNKDYCFIEVENYIIGDVTGFQLLPDKTAYAYEHGIVYDTPVSLRLEMILSQEQMDIGLDRDYLGMYDYVESYRSAQGYRVNILRGTEGDGQVDAMDVKTEKIAIFVADGIRYTLTGRVSLDTMKEIVDSMQ